jgi:hypothetical protein
MDPNDLLRWLREHVDLRTVIWIVILGGGIVGPIVRGVREAAKRRREIEERRARGEVGEPPPPVPLAGRREEPRLEEPEPLEEVLAEPPPPPPVVVVAAPARRGQEIARESRRRERPFSEPGAVPGARLAESGVFEAARRELVAAPAFEAPAAFFDSDGGRLGDLDGPGEDLASGADEAPEGGGSAAEASGGLLPQDWRKAIVASEVLGWPRALRS